MGKRKTSYARLGARPLALAWLFALVLLMLSNTTLLAQEGANQATRIYLPFIAGADLAGSDMAGTMAGTETAGPQALVAALAAPETQMQDTASDPCAINRQEREAAELFRNDPNQHRGQLVCNPLLAAIARAKAQDLAARNYFDHVNPDGIGPNMMLQRSGYALPNVYYQTPDANNVESLAAGFETAAGAWAGWLNSEHHRVHVLGADPFFVQQTQYGIGYYYDPTSFYQHYWVLLTAHDVDLSVSN